jgi:hypothetical protein
VHPSLLRNTAANTPIRLDYVFLALSIFGTFCILGWVLGYAQYGLDLTDESFYLVWISNPFIYDASVSQFGFVYHPLHLALGGDLVALRRANIVIIFLLSWALVDAVLKQLLSGVHATIAHRLVISAGFATVSMTAVSLWLTTPSYNSLNLQALLITSIGLLYASKTPSLSSTASWAVIGVGGWLVFMAKPSSAAALAVSTLIYLALTRKLSAKPLVVSISVTVAMFAASAYLIDGSPTLFIQRIREALTLSGHVDSGHSFAEIFRVGDYNLTDYEQNLLLFVSFYIFLATHLLMSPHRLRLLAGVTLTVLPVLAVVAVTSDKFQLHHGLGYFQNLLVWAVVFSGIAIFVLHILVASPHPRSTHALTAILLLVMPYIYAFGSNGNYWWVAGYAAIFWMAGALFGLGPLIRKHNSALVLLPTLLVAQAITAVLVQSGVERPYRQTQPLRTNSHAIQVGSPGSQVLLAEPNGAFLTEAMSLTRDAGFEAGTPMIDLTGRSPGILYLLKAESIGQAWTMGGYPGSLDLAVAALRRVPCNKLAVAWLLQEEKGSNRISPELLDHFGAKVERDYVVAARWITSRGAGGHRSYEQTLLKPIRSQEQATTACERAKLVGGSD